MALLASFKAWVRAFSSAFWAEVPGSKAVAQITESQNLENWAWSYTFVIPALGKLKIISWDKRSSWAAWATEGEPISKIKTEEEGSGYSTAAEHFPGTCKT